MTLYERIKSYDFTLAYVGDGNNVCNSLIIASSVFGFKINVSTPKGYEPSEEAVRKAEKLGSGLYEWFEDPRDAVRGVDAVYTDTWISMGDESEEQVRLRAFREWQVNSDLMSFASKDAFFMHCLPAHKGHEVTEDVFESSRSIVFDQAENRLHTAAAYFLYIWREVRS
jgi:ornithine carbamoyltransferase